VLENFVEVFNRNGNILVEKLSSHVNGPEFDVTPYMTLCALDDICGECRDSRLYRKKLHSLIITKGQGHIKMALLTCATEGSLEPHRQAVL
jgi:hypothetical protein